MRVKRERPKFRRVMRGWGLMVFRCGQMKKRQADKIEVDG